jgi:arylsulfatase
MTINEYLPGTPFPGKIGRTVDQSEPAWPVPKRAKPGAPNVLFFLLDDVGFAQLKPYGGLIEVPNIERLAENGLMYTNMHTTALCSPTRACVITGRNHHSNAMGSIGEWSTGYPGYNSRVPFEHGFMSEILKEEGYNTFGIGKWHLCVSTEESQAGPYDTWPLGRGFERFYGFLAAETDQWYPDLTYDNHSVNPPKTPEEGYHLSEDLADKAIEFIGDAHVNAPDKPFFMYYCTGAGHAPHHIFQEWADKYKGKFDMGWDEFREIAFAKQKKLGFFPAEAEISATDPDVPVWDALSDDEKRLYTRMMEVHAGFVSHADHHFGRILDFLEEIGELDNTLIMFISDNGASPEGGEVGSLNEYNFFNFAPEDLEENLKMIDELGSPSTYNHYPWGWAHAGNTPFRRWKKEIYRGGASSSTGPQASRPRAKRVRSMRMPSIWCRPCWTPSILNRRRALKARSRPRSKGSAWCTPSKMRML